MQSGRNKIFAMTTETADEYDLEREYLRVYASNSDVESFEIRNRGRYLLFLEELSAFCQVPPNIARYLKQHESELRKRAACQRKNCRWWQYTWPLHREYYGVTDRIICPYRSASNRFAFDVKDEVLTLNDTTVIFLDRKASISSSAVEALLNSTLLTFRYRGIGKLTAQNSWEYFDYGLARLPIEEPESSREKGLCTRLHKLATVAHGEQTGEVRVGQRD